MHTKRSGLLLGAPRCLFDVPGFGEAPVLPSCRLPASRWLPLSNGMPPSLRLVLRTKSLQSSLLG